MDLTDFTNKSQKYISSLIAKSDFDVKDDEVFCSFIKSVKLNDLKYNVNFFRRLTGYKPNSESEWPVLYTFFILEPPFEYREDFLYELERKKNGLAYDETVLGEYYLPFTKGNEDFELFIEELTQSLETKLYAKKGYRFVYHLSCSTKEHNIAVVFVEMNSVYKINKAFDGKVPFDLL